MQGMVCFLYTEEKGCKWRHVGHARGSTNAYIRCLNRPCIGGSIFLIGLLIGQMGNGLEVGFNGSWIIGLKMTRQNKIVIKSNK